MNAIALPRITVPTLSLPDVGRLALRINEEVGYTPLLRELNTVTIMKVLAAHDSLPFENAAVQQYMDKQLHKALGNIKWYLLPSLRRNWAMDWYSCSLQEYKLPVPLDILNKVLELRAAFREHHMHPRFGISYLGDVDFERVAKLEAIERMRREDPFLFMEISERRYYIDVWDEPTFVRK